MDPGLIFGIDHLQYEINQMTSSHALFQEIQSIPEGANRIAAASILDGPMPHLYIGVDALKRRINHLMDEINSGDTIVKADFKMKSEVGFITY